MARLKTNSQKRILRQEIDDLHCMGISIRFLTSKGLAEERGRGWKEGDRELGKAWIFLVL